MIELVKGFRVNPKLVAVVKDLGEEECALFTAGQSATDGGFRLEASGQEVEDVLNEAEEEEDETEGDEDDEEEDD